MWKKTDRKANNLVFYLFFCLFEPLFNEDSILPERKREVAAVV